MTDRPLVSRLRITVLGLALGVLLPGCVSGFIYTHTVQPLTVNFQETPVATNKSNGDVKRFRYNFVDIQWDKNGIGEIAKKYGFKEIYYADLEILSILGIWTQRHVHVYGKK
jgi:hypothetical protein